MKYLFIDDFKFEIRNGKKKGKYFGLAFVFLDASKYNKFKTGFDSFIKKTKWPANIEFKGRYFFDGKGLKSEAQNVWVSKHNEIRNNIATFFDKDIFSGKYKKISLFYYYVKGEKNIENYKKVLCAGVCECLKKKTSQGAKNYCAIYADSENSLKGVFDSFSNIFLEVKTKTVIFENNLNFVASSNFSPGIQLADIFAYSAQWYLSDDKEIRLDVTLFDNKNQKLKKETMGIVKKYLDSIVPICREI